MERGEAFRQRCVLKVHYAFENLVFTVEAMTDFFVISSIPDSPIHFALSAKHQHLPQPANVNTLVQVKLPEVYSTNLPFFFRNMLDYIMMSTAFFSNMMTCRLVYRYLCFGGTCCVHLHVQYNLYSFSFAITIWRRNYYFFF